MQRPDIFGARCDPVSISVQFHNELLRMKIRKELSLQEFTGSNLINTLYSYAKISGASITMDFRIYLI